MSLIDSHFHIDKYREHSSIYNEINQLRQYTLCVTCMPGVFLSCREMYPETKYLRFGLGIHPLEINDSQRSIFEFDQCINDARYIGEIGLDYSQKTTNREKQLTVFRHVMKQQARQNIPASIHLRKSEDDAIEIISRGHNKKCIIHWFTGSDTQLESLISLGCYFSVNTAMIRSLDQITQIKKIPTNRLLIESDGPYTQISGKRFTPNFLVFAYKAISNAIGVQELEHVVYTNYLSLLC